MPEWPQGPVATMNVLHGELFRLGRRVERWKARPNALQGYQFKVTPSCPPDLCLNMRGGRIHADPEVGTYRGAAWEVPALTACLDGSNTFYDWGTFTWTQTGYYLGCLLVLNGGHFPGSDWTDIDFYLDGTGVEYASAPEAEDAIHHYIWAGSQTWRYGYPLCLVILRNDGTLTDWGHLPIDAVNRGRSYLWRDMRAPRWLNTTGW